MSIKNFLFLILALSFLFQIFFSVYYSSEILNQNSSHLVLLEKINHLEIERQDLKTKLSVETSLNKINQYLKEKNYQPLWQQINLNQP